MVEDIASSMSLLVDRNLASFLDKGTISGLGYAGTIGNIASTMIATAIMTASFPMFSKMLASGERDRFSLQFGKYAAAISYLLGPISVFMILNSNDIVTFIFEHGAFDKAATKIVSESMMCYAVGVLPMGLQSYLIRGFYAIQDTKTPVKIKVFALACNITLNLITVRYIKHMGIALSTSVSYGIAYFLLTRSLKKKHGIEGMGKITAEGCLSLIFSIVPGVGLFFVFNKMIIHIPNLFIKLMLEGILFVGSFIALMIVFRRDRVKDIVGAIKR
jgi:putative peptidoglycan lipid II flippase